MKKVLLSIVAATFAANTAAAEQAESNFDGFYVGALASHTSMNADYVLQPRWADMNFSPMQISHMVDGWQGGIVAGYNWDVGAPQGWVLGIEADYLAGTVGVDTFSDNPPQVFDLGGDKVSVGDQVTVRGRVGYDVNGFMPYVAAGVSCAAVTVQSGYMPYRSLDESGTTCGGTAAAGVEYAVGNGWSVRGEYRVTDFGTVQTQQGIIGIVHQF